MLGRLSREPQGGSAPQLIMASGCFMLFVSLFLIFVPSKSNFPVLYAGVTITGFELALGAVAEMLPRSARRPAALLRATALALSIIGAAVIIATLWLIVN